MLIKKILKKSELIIGLVRDVKRLIKLPKQILRAQNQKKNIKKYLNSSNKKKLQLGSGRNIINGWLSSDIFPQSNDIVSLNVKKEFPFENDSFDYIYSEHMIEHISWDEGSFMLSECKRILKSGGKIRLATPDLEMLLSLANSNDIIMKEKYIKWITEQYLPNIKVYHPSFVINNAFHNWGHKFLYDEEILTMQMQKAGFTNIQRFNTNESNDDNFKNIESHGKAISDSEMAIYETMILEGELLDK